LTVSLTPSFVFPAEWPLNETELIGMKTPVH